MILIGLGSNLPSHAGDSVATIHEALTALGENGIRVIATSRFWKTAPVPVSDQPWFVNAVAALYTVLSPQALLVRLHDIERRFDRERYELNAARTLDLDILDYNGLIHDSAPILPHPRLDTRAFVLLPLKDIAPDWVHPRSGTSLDALIAALPQDQVAEPFDA
jgi:2-amino-4-hydroxy-6-hydroxymethyldihydropteridine diphosphokinase